MSDVSVAMFGAGLPEEVTVDEGVVVTCEIPEEEADSLVVYLDVAVRNMTTDELYGRVKGTIETVPEYRDASDVRPY